MPMYDFECACGHEMEDLIDAGAFPACPKCGEDMFKVWRDPPKLFSKIIPDYPGSKRLKAGYTHTAHADHSATKIQSGYGGCVSPKDV
jgi:putative FmdB family regulatory protein